MPDSKTPACLFLACALIGASGTLLAQNRIAFVTSAAGNGKLDSWPEAGDGLQGLAAADSICVALANTAGLANTGNFKAWLSDNSDDAYCRVHGLSGKKANNCGEPALPVAAGPWLRTDGLPWAGTIVQIINDSVVYVPLLVDENGASLPENRRAWSSTAASGEDQASSCSGWTDDGVASGSSLPLATTGWYGSGGSFCNATDVHLVCLETGTGPAIELAEPDGNIAFFTSASGTGDLASWADAVSGTSGIEAGDSVCNALAEEANLPFQGSYKAWLSDDTVDARDRFDHDGPWDRLDGLRIASSLEDLSDGVLNTSNHLTESGIYRNNNGVWSGTRADGTADPANCDNWQSNTGTGRVGRSSYNSGGWTDFENANCFSDINHLHCLSDVDFSPKRVFASSAKGTANLGEWPQAGTGLTGTAAADSVCESLATTAGLDNPQNFVAWLSDSNDDAYCRIHHLEGKVIDNCGQPELPQAAGPWIRTDGVPAWASVANLIASPMAFFTPILKDENGAEVNRNEHAWSATDDIGAAQSVSFNCSDWTNDNTGSGLILPLHYNAWNSITFAACSQDTGHLVCVETGQAEKLIIPQSNGNIAFLTSASGNGDLDSWADASPGAIGIQAADSICNNLAAAAGLPFQGSYKAWLSDTQVSASDRFQQRGSWQRPDGIVIADNLADLVDGALFAALLQTEQGDYLNFDDVWTGTDASGAASNFHCDNWDSTDGVAVKGRSAYTIAGWSAFNTGNCAESIINHLYCLSDVELVYLFSDGFEDL